MKKWSSRWIVVSLLGIMLGAGMTLSAVQANTMTVDMALAGDINPAGDEDCGGCGTDGVYPRPLSTQTDLPSLTFRPRE